MSRGWTFEEIRFHYDTEQNKVGGASKPVVVNGRRYASIEAAKAALGVSGFYLQRLRIKHQISSEEALNLIVSKRSQGEDDGAKASIKHEPET